MKCSTVTDSGGLLHQHELWKPANVTGKSFWLLLLVILAVATATGQTITVGGTVRDSYTLSGIAGAHIELVNILNPADRCTVSTGATGEWQYVFPSAGVGPGQTVPSAISLEQNFPNPFNPSTTIRFSVRHEGQVRLTVHNVLGQLIDERTLSLSAGGYEIVWSSKGAAGALFYTIEAEGIRQTKKMIQLDGGSGGGWGDIRLTQGVATGVAQSASAQSEYMVTATKIGYEPDSTTILLVDGARKDIQLETVHRRAFVADLHNDVLETAVIYGYDMGIRNSMYHTDIPRLEDGGVDFQMFAVWIDPGISSTLYNASAHTMIDSFQAQVARNPSTLAQVTNATEALQANASHKIAGMLSIEGGHVIDNSIAKLIEFYGRGVRAMTITWNNSTSWAVSNSDPNSATVGLSDFGKQVIRTMDSLGMIIDISHVGIKTAADIFATSKNPIIASHSGARALCNNRRNLSDAQLDTLKAHGGVVGVVFYPWFLSSTGHATIDSVIKHIDYIKNRIGIDYIALGSDFDGIEVTPVGLEDVSKFPALTMALLQHGYSVSDIRKLLGENYLRVFNAVCH